MSVSDTKSKARSLKSPGPRTSHASGSKQMEQLGAAAGGRVTHDAEINPQSYYWDQQLSLAMISRKQQAPHHYARATAQASKSEAVRAGAMTAPGSSAGNTKSMMSISQTPGSQAAPGTLAEAVVWAVKNNRERERERAEQSRSAQVAAGTPSRNNNSNNGNNYNSNPQEKKDLIEEEKQRQINEEVHHQFWTAVDLSGMGLSVLSPRLFEYQFLQKLYLDHNHLETVPKSLRRLPHLKTLDLSGNHIKGLPAELGLMTSLRHLLLFDNELTELPAELGSLFQLELIGLAGNFLSKEILEILSEGGTKAVIQHLRDHAPAGEPPRPRQWLDLDVSGQERHGSTGQENVKAPGFSILTYNTLCERYATPSLYGYTPSWALTWEYRSQLLVHEVFANLTDIICLQEVNRESYESMWLGEFESRGYISEILQKSRAKTMNDRHESNAVDGCVTAYKKDKFKKVDFQEIYFSSFVLQKQKGFDHSPDLFNRFMSKDNVALVFIFEHIGTGQPVIIVNTHLHWDPAFGDVKLAQSAFLLEEVEKFATKYCQSDTPEGRLYPNLTDLRQLPVVVCGDFNSDKSSGVYQLFSQGVVPPKHPDFKEYQYGRFVETGINHSLALKSAYADGVSLKFTNFTPNFVALIDYIWYSTQNLRVTSVMSEVDPEYVKRYVGFPNQHHPSDHISIAAQLTFTRLLTK